MDGHSDVATPKPVSNLEVKHVYVPVRTAFMCGRPGKLSSFLFSLILLVGKDDKVQG
jgi:hypothetical protein